MPASGRRGQLSRESVQVLASDRREPLPEPPDDLSDFAREVYEETGRQCPWLDASDRLLVMQLAELEDECRQLRKVVAESGPVVMVPVVAGATVVGEKPVANPAVGQLRRAEGSLERVRHALALTPQVKARLGLRARAAQADADRAQAVETERQSNLLDQYREAAGQ